jgi:transcriptional regulator GlxA family with amidase domain
MKAKHIVIIVPPLTSILDVAGPLDVFFHASVHIDNQVFKSQKSYITHVISTEESNIVNTSSGLPIVCESSFKSINYDIDTILVTGIPNAPVNMVNPETLEWLRIQAKSCHRIGSICAGAFVLAEAGILNGKRATSHWMVCDKLARLYPEIKVEKDPIFVKDGNVYTSAGISTGMDLSLAMVEEDYGRDIALSVARRLVLYLKRPGNQSQFSVMLEHQKVDHQPISELISWIMDHLNEPLSVEILAEKISMSPRNFARVFLRETGITPAKYIEKVRLETARRRLEETKLTLDEISAECGVGDADTLRRLFLRHMRTTPSEYRRSFTTALV